MRKWFQNTMIFLGMLWVSGTATAALAPENTIVVANRDSNDLALINSVTDQVEGKIQLPQWSNPHMAMMSHDGKYIVSSLTNRNACAIIDFNSRQVLKVIPTGTEPEHFDISPDSSVVYMGNMGDGTVSVIDLRELKETARLDGFFEPHGFRFTLDGQKIYVSNFGAHEIAVIPTDKPMLAKRVAVGESFQFAALNPTLGLADVKGIANPTLTPDGKFFYAADGDANQVSIIDATTDAVVKRLKIGAEPWRAYASPDGRWVLIPCNGDQNVSVIDTRTQKVVSTFPAGEGMTGINFGVGSEKAYVIAGAEGTVYVYDLKKMAVVKQLVIGKNLMLETACSTDQDRKLYLACSTNNSVYVIDTTTDQVKQIPEVGGSPWGTASLHGQGYCH